MTDALYTTAKPVVLSNTVTMQPTAGLYVGGAGNVVVVMAGDTTNTPVTFSGVTAGTLLRIKTVQVQTTSTATLMLALY